MNPRTSYSILIILMFFSLSLKAQDSCNVLLPTINKSYDGACKKGLAHGYGRAKGIDSYEGNFKKGLPDGKGTYVWSTGEVYQGQWRKGERSGIGTYFYKIDGRDTSIFGVWKHDKYLGKKMKKPSISLIKNIDRYDIFSSHGIQNRVLVDFRQNGMQNTRIENLMLNADSGTPVQIGQRYGFDNVIFPVTISVRYDTYNKLGTQKVDSFIEFTIYEKGDWNVVLTN